jgi:dTMP kinase
MPGGLFVTFEGLDGVGKTTQIKRLAAWLQESGLAVTVTRQPGGTATGERIRALALDSRLAGLAPMAEMALMFADRAQAIAEVIGPALESGRIVLCDRFTDSTEAYQGGGRELGSNVVLELHRLLCGNLQPDLTLLLLPPLETALEANLARARHRNRHEAARGRSDEGRFEAEQDAFHRRVWEKYKEIAAREPSRVVVIAGEQSIEQVHQQVVAAVQNLLDRHGLLDSAVRVL